MPKPFVVDTLKLGAGPRITGGYPYPSEPPGVPAELGSYYVCTVDGTWWQKTVGGDTEWVQLRTVGAANGDSVDLVRGMPVAPDGDQVQRASASSFGLSLVVGIVTVYAEPTLVTQFLPIGLSMLTPAEWDVVTGQTGGLTPGATYYLSTTPGMLTTTPPSLEGQCVVRVGHAISAHGLLVQPQPPIRL